MKTIYTILLLVVSNIFMTFAWYGNLKLTDMGIIKDWPLILIILASWGVALLEYSFMVPDRKSTRLNSSHIGRSRMPSSA